MSAWIKATPYIYKNGKWTRCSQYYYEEMNTSDAGRFDVITELNNQEREPYQVIKHITTYIYVK